MGTSLSFEHGTQTASGLIGVGAETYDFITGSLDLNYPLLKRVSLGLSYRFTLRASNIAGRGYTQDVIGLVLTYLPQ